MSNRSILLTDLPWNVKKCITSSTDLKTRMSLRKCSREFRRIVKYLHTTYQKMEIKLQLNSVIFMFTDKPADAKNSFYKIFQFSVGSRNRQTVEYHFHTEGCVIRSGEWEKLIEGADHIEMAVRDFETFVRKENVKVDKLHLSIDEKSYDTCQQYPNESDSSWELKKQDTSLLLKYLSQSLERIGDELKVRWFRTEIPFKQDEFLPVFECFHPETLETIQMSFSPYQQKINKIFDTEQWKKAKTLDLVSHSGGPIVPASALFGFSRISTTNIRFSAKEIISLIEAAVKHGEKFRETRLISTYYNDRMLRNYLSAFPRSQDFWKIEIPGSEWYLKVEAKEEYVIIESVHHSKPEEPKINNPELFSAYTLWRFYGPIYRF